MMGKAITHRDILKKFGEKLQRVRKLRKISQEELAAKLSMHRTYIGMIERGERNPTIRTLYKIAKALNVSASEILPF
jgi:transcriptional regulator with XRE-family HTH domain